MSDNFRSKYLPVQSQQDENLGKIWNSSQLITKKPERPQWHLSGIFIGNFERMSDFFLVFLLLTLDK